MTCSLCGMDCGESGACSWCGAALGTACGSCGARNPAGFRFCGLCAAPLAQESSAAGERRQITVVFSDLVDFTALASEMDPEELHELVQAYHAECTRAIAAEGGYVAQHLGDGTLAYFGWPAATERSAEGAVRAALALLQVVETLGARYRGRFRTPLAARVGVHTGLVVVGEVGAGGRTEQLALGTVPNIAARLQALAEPGTVLLSETTHRLVAGDVRCEPVGMRAVKGVERPLALFRVLGERGGAPEFPEGAGAGATPPVGREWELHLLRERWDEALAGRGQAAVLLGEAGIGKSHLIRAFLSSLEPRSFRLVEIQCQSRHQNSASPALIEYLRRRVDRGTEPVLRERKRRMLELLEEEASRSGPSARRLDPRTREALVELMLGSASLKPVVIVVENLHWVDPWTLDLIKVILPPLAGARAMLLMTQRPGFRAGLPALDHLTWVGVGPLWGTMVREIATTLAGGKALPPELLEQIVERTDGIPLFVEELTRMVLESGILRDCGDHLELDGPLPPLAIPTSLHDALQARLDRLAATKEIAQIGAVIGREFGYPLLRAVARMDPDLLGRGLRRLVDAGLIEEHGTAPESTYTFRHALVQETAYQGMLRATRRRIHAQTLRALVEEFPEAAAAHPEAVARHRIAAGLDPQTGAGSLAPTPGVAA